MHHFLTWSKYTSSILQAVLAKYIIPLLDPSILQVYFKQSWQSTSLPYFDQVYFKQSRRSTSTPYFDQVYLKYTSSSLGEVHHFHTWSKYTSNLLRQSTAKYVLRQVFFMYTSRWLRLKHNFPTFFITLQQHLAKYALHSIFIYPYKTKRIILPCTYIIGNTRRPTGNQSYTALWTQCKHTK